MKHSGTPDRLGIQPNAISPLVLDKTLLTCLLSLGLTFCVASFAPSGMAADAPGVHGSPTWQLLALVGKPTTIALEKSKFNIAFSKYTVRPVDVSHPEKVQPPLFGDVLAGQVLLSSSRLHGRVALIASQATWKKGTKREAPPDEARWTIRVKDKKGRAVTYLADFYYPETSIGEPAWAPDGSLCFVVSRQDRVAESFLALLHIEASPDGSLRGRMETVEGPVWGLGGVTWNPSSHCLAYEAHENEVKHSIRLRGQKVSSVIGDALFPVWSADGAFLAYVVAPGGDERTEPIDQTICIWRGNGGDVHSLLTQRHSIRPLFFLDKPYRLVFLRPYELWQVEVDSGKAERLWGHKYLTKDMIDITPGGETLAIWVFRTESEKDAIATLDLKTRSFKEIAPMPEMRKPWTRIRWTPDGSAIVYATVKNRICYTMRDGRIRYIGSAQDIDFW